MRIRIMEHMEGRLGDYDLTRFTPMLIYDVDDELGALLIETGRAIPDRTGAPAVVILST